MRLRVLSLPIPPLCIIVVMFTALVVVCEGQCPGFVFTKGSPSVVLMLIVRVRPDDVRLRNSNIRKGGYLSTYNKAQPGMEERYLIKGGE